MPGTAPAPPFDPASLKWAAEYGALFILALIMFYFYRSDRKERETDLKEENTKLLEALVANTSTLSSLRSTLEQNSRVVETLAGHCVAVQVIKAGAAKYTMKKDKQQQEEEEDPQ